MILQDYLLQKFKSWLPSAPEVLDRTKREITLDWKQQEFQFLQEDLLYRIEKNNRFPKWIVVYSGGKTFKTIDDLAPSYPHRFRMKVILKATSVPLIAAKALEYYGNEQAIYDKLENKEEIDGETQIIERGDGDVNIETTVEDISDSKKKINNNQNKGIKRINTALARGQQLHSRNADSTKWVESLFSEETWTSTDSEGTSAVCFSMAVKCGDLKQVQSMLEERPELIGIVNASNGLTPLATAVRRGDVNMCKFLLSLGVDLEQPSCAGQTALHLAAFAGQLEIVELLLESGADCQARDWNGLRVEHCAVDSGRVDAVRLVLDRGGLVGVIDNNGWTPLFRALCQGARTEMVAELVSRGSDLDVVDHAGLPLVSVAKLLKNRHGRNRESILRLVDSSYPKEKALANFTRLTKKIYNVHALFKLT